jgi:hypothetical protein
LDQFEEVVVTAERRGLICSEGKANQYLMRGFNLDHGANLGMYVDGMPINEPINEPTNAHGQGYTDLNFMIP